MSLRDYRRSGQPIPMTSDNEYEVHANVPQSYSYRLMELTPELLKVIEEKKEPLVLKAPTSKSEVVLCTSSETFALRQRNHSNTVMMTKEGERDGKKFFCSYATLSNVFEVRKSEGHIITEGIPLYDGQNKITNTGESVTLDELKTRSAISDLEFESNWFALNGSSLNGQAIILTDDIITRTLHVMIMSIMASSLDFSELSLIEVFQSMGEDPDITIDIVETVLRKFVTNDREPYQLNKAKVVQWYGIETLRRHCRTKPIELSDFFIKWKSELPPFFESSLDIPLLRGNYAMPLPERIQYVSKLELPSDIQNRLKVLFKLQSSWNLTELAPFIEEFNHKNVKIENFVMKFAKKKKQGKKIIITQR